MVHVKPSATSYTFAAGPPAQARSDKDNGHRPHPSWPAHARAWAHVPEMFGVSHHQSQRLFVSLSFPSPWASGTGATTRSKTKGKMPASLFDQPPHPKLAAGGKSGSSVATRSAGKPLKKAVYKKEKVPTASGKSTEWVVCSYACWCNVMLQTSLTQEASF